VAASKENEISLHVFFPNLEREYTHEGSRRRQKNHEVEGALFKNEKQGQPDFN
jgi:hypothetical protein